jgi:hypothetical protein
MEGLVLATSKGRFISILSDGMFHEKTTEDTEGAVLRKYELRDGTKGEKWELVYQKVENVMITGVRFEDGEYGKNLLIDLSDGENEITIAQGVATNFGEDLLKKLPAVNFAEKVSLQPYSFISEKNGKPVKGVNIYQKSDKVLSHFWDGEKKVNGFPEPEGNTEEYSTDDWKLFFLQARKFLVAYNTEHVLPRFAEKDELEEQFKEKVEEEETPRPEDIPF